MLKLQILTYLSKNPEAKAAEIAYALDQDKSAVNSILYKCRDLGLAQFNGVDYSWTLSEEGSQHLPTDDTPHQRDQPMSKDLHAEQRSSDQVEADPVQSPELDLNISKMFGFLEEWYKMDLTPLCDITADSRVLWCKLTNQTVQGLPGILVGAEVEDKSCWLSIERLKPVPPPVLPELLEDWTSVQDDPGKTPQIAPSISVVDREATDALWEDFHEETVRVAALPDEERANVEPIAAPSDVIVEISLEDRFDVQLAWNDYSSE